MIQTPRPSMGVSLPRPDGKTMSYMPKGLKTKAGRPPRSIGNARYWHQARLDNAVGLFPAVVSGSDGRDAVNANQQRTNERPLLLTITPLTRRKTTFPVGEGRSHRNRDHQKGKASRADHSHGTPCHADKPAVQRQQDNGRVNRISRRQQDWPCYSFRLGRGNCFRQRDPDRPAASSSCTKMPPPQGWASRATIASMIGGNKSTSRFVKSWSGTLLLLQTLKTRKGRSCGDAGAGLNWLNGRGHRPR